MTPRRIYALTAALALLWVVAEAAAALLATEPPTAALIIAASVKAGIALTLAGLLLVLVTRHDAPIATRAPLVYTAYPERAPERRQGAQEATDSEGRPLRRRASDAERVKAHLEQELADELNKAQEA